MTRTQPLDKLRICDLRASCYVGIYPREQQRRQPVLLNLTLHADLRRACRTDRFEDTVDYKALKNRILDLARKERFALIEHLAERVAGLSLADRRVRQADVRVSKLSALRHARAAEVEIVRIQSTQRAHDGGNDEEETTAGK